MLRDENICIFSLANSRHAKPWEHIKMSFEPYNYSFKYTLCFKIEMGLCNLYIWYEYIKIIVFSPVVKQHRLYSVEEKKATALCFFFCPLHLFKLNLFYKATKQNQHTKDVLKSQQENWRKSPKNDSWNPFLQ